MSEANARRVRADHDSRVAQREAARRAPLRLVEPGEAPPARRTVRIAGQVPAPRTRPVRTTRTVARPDRVALWAVVFGLFLAFMAGATARGGDTAPDQPVAPAAAR